MSIKRRDIALKAIAMQMLEEGKVLTKREYEMLRNRTEVRAGTLMNMFGSWSRMLTIMENSLPGVAVIIVSDFTLYECLYITAVGLSTLCF